ncbi:phage tail length tape measure family protein [Algimonas porphyrae]|uniref:Bacteriophage tail tape measure N-terminal domain-containing protein n=1 Tax=Algimonas porphyrae TaxID=1128113 RepID=A0ABQ5UYQ0_9PROT|nr:phage tail length tape measure family protein [Algimonas porphyrae]GLQ20396.1 hypothetical protein GCM10007854_13510 [Algimonas porphyrae]
MAQALIGALRVDLALRTAAFEKGVTEAQKRIRALDRTMKRVGRRLQSAGRAMSIGITAPMAAIGVSATNTAIQYREAAAQVEQGLKTMGDASGKTLAGLKADAVALENTSLFTQQDILQTVTANMLTFGNISGEAFDRAQQSALDLSQRLGQDLKSSTIQIGKALNDPIRGVTALSRVGVQFTDQQRDMIKSMVEAGNTAGAQAMILSELEKQYAGSAQAAQDAAPGDEIQDAWNRFKLILGEIVLQYLPPITDALARMIDKFNEMTPATQKTVLVLGGLAAAIGPILIALGALTAAFTTLMAVAGPLAILTGGVLALKAAFDLIAPFWQNARLSHEALNAVLNQGVNARRELQAATLDNVEGAKAAARAAITEAEASLKAADAQRERARTAAKTAKLLGGVSPAMQALHRKFIIDAAEQSQTINRLRDSIASTKAEINSADVRLGIAPTPAVATTLPTTTSVPSTSGSTTTDAKKAEVAARKENIAAIRAELKAKTEADRAEEDMLNRLAREQSARNDARRSVIDQIAANHQLADAYKISETEGRIVAEMLRIQATEASYTTEELRRLAEQTVKSSDIASDAMDKARKDAKDSGDAMEEAFTRGANAFTGLIKAIESGDIGSILSQGIQFLSQLFGKGRQKGSAGGQNGGGLSDIIGKFAGMFDKGGRIPSGKFGIAGEFGPEFVRGPAVVTSREATARALSGVGRGSSMPPVRIAVEANDYFDARVIGHATGVTDARAPAHAQATLSSARRSNAKRAARRVMP